MELSEHETQWLQGEGAQMLKELGAKQGDCAIDFGCGEGRYTTPLSQVVGPEGTVYAVDRSGDAIAALKERLAEFSTVDSVTTLNVEDLHTGTTIPEKTVDFAMTFDVLQYVEDWKQLFSYFSRVLRPGGIVCIYPAAIPHPDSVDMKVARSTMEEVGFRYVGATTFRMMHNVHMVDDTVHRFCLG